MKALNRKRKPKHSTKTKYCLYRYISTLKSKYFYRQVYNYSKKRSRINIIVAIMFQCNSIHFCTERYTSKIALI